MNRFTALVVLVLLCGCGGDGGENAPIIHLKISSENGSSVSQHRVERTGIISESGESPAGGPVTSSQSITVDKIADDCVTVTVTMFESDTGDSSKQFHVRYDKETTVAISDGATATARLERKE